MRPFTLALASAALLSASPALAGPAMLETSAFNDLGKVFSAADLDGDRGLSRTEYSWLRSNLVDDNWVRDYRGDARKDMAPTVARTYEQFDRNSDGMISQSEFVTIARRAPAQPVSNAATLWDWRPEYVTATYFLTVSPVDADTLDGREIVNLKGEEVGEITDIIKTDDENRYYALIDLKGGGLDRYPSFLETDTVGVPLSDVLLPMKGEALLISTRGEDYLRDAKKRNIGDDYTSVEKLYGVSPS